MFCDILAYVYFIFLIDFPCFFHKYFKDEDLTPEQIAGKCHK